MIIFYNKKTGDIVGTIDGRIHAEDHLKMWVGTKEENDRIIVNWIPFQWYDIKGRKVGKNDKNKKGQRLAFTADYTPDHSQKELFVEIENNPRKLQEYKVNLQTKLFVKK